MNTKKNIPRNYFYSCFDLKKIGAVFAIFLFAFSIRTYSLNQIGRTWDEDWYMMHGYKMINFFKAGDVLNKIFIEDYVHPHLPKYAYGLTANFDLKNIENGNPIFNYDFTYSRILSSIFGSLSAVIILLIAWEYVSKFVGVTSGIIFSTLPLFIGLSQLVSIESFLMFFFTISIYSFIKLLEKYSIKKLILTGIFVGLALQVKQSNLLLFPIFGLIYLVWYFNKKNRSKDNILNKELTSIVYIFFISIIVFILIYPPILLHLDAVLELQKKFYMVTTATPVVFYGLLILSPIIYFPILFLITTPMAIIVLALLGLWAINKKGNWILYAFIIWFCTPFIHSFYPWRYHGVRFIIEIYAPLSILTAIGIDYLIRKLKFGIKAKFFSVFLITLYMLSIIYQIRPYYLDYFNELVGGPKGVYDKQYFELGWWGQGLREAGYYLQDNAKKNSSIALFISPSHVFPPIKNQKLIFMDPNKEIYNSKIKYDYVVVNYFHVLREGFDDSKIKQDYRLMYQVKVDDASLVDIYSKE